ncbi:hypothetical protein KAW50_08715 [candidate division WOR-3 bacterium]|nr:hypothetical protein [candidate division WOR-3 bacterium]
MAKVDLGCLVRSISGSMGGITFYKKKGVHRIMSRKRKKEGIDRKSEKQIRIREGFCYFHKRWLELSLTEMVLWEEYSKHLRELERSGGLIPSYGNKIATGKGAYMGTNLMLMAVGFPEINKPCLGKVAVPPCVNTDIVQHSMYKGMEVKFRVWLPYLYGVDCKAQIWVKGCLDGGFPYVQEVISVGVSPVEVKIRKVRKIMYGKEKKLIEMPIGERSVLRMKIQLRTIAKNGKSSMASVLYLVEVRN